LEGGRGRREEGGGRRREGGGRREEEGEKGGQTFFFFFFSQVAHFSQILVESQSETLENLKISEPNFLFRSNNNMPDFFPNLKKFLYIRGPRRLTWKKGDHMLTCTREEGWSD
jgi:hypothetical protein